MTEQYVSVSKITLPPTLSSRLILINLDKFLFGLLLTSSFGIIFSSDKV